MRKTPTLVFLCAATCAAAAFGENVLEKQVPLPAGGKVEIHNRAGIVDLQTWDRPEVSVTAELGEDCTGVEVLEEGGGLHIEVKVKEGKSNKDIRSTVYVKVPEACVPTIQTLSAEVHVQRPTGTLEINTASGDITVQFKGSRATLKSISGDIHLQGVADQVELNSASGEITALVDADSVRAETVSGDIELSGNHQRVIANTTSGNITHNGAVAHMQANTVSGDVEIEMVTEALDAFTSGGELDIRAANLRELHAETISGDILYQGGLAEAGAIEISSKSGEVELHLPDSVPARYILKSFSGQVSAPVQARQEAGSGSEVTFEQGAGTARVNVQTFSGDLILTHSSPAE